jgi:imidazolonepropionase
MTTLFTDITELYTPFERLTTAALVVAAGQIVWLGAQRDLPAAYAALPPVSLGQQGVLPGFVDCHTHLVWAGARLDEYLQRARGASYEAILEAGGGIYNTVSATQRASEDELFALAQARAALFQRGGVSTMEVKSGYGLEAEHELKMLRVIRRLAAELPQRVVATLLAHVIPKGWTRTAYVDMFCRELIPEVKRSGLAEAVDVFCDRGAFTLAETEQIFSAALDHQLAIKAHAEQIEHTGVSKLVADLQGLSADHLEQSTADDWQALAAAQTVATLLPGATVLLRKAFPDLRGLRAAGVKIAVATDHNPGSSPLYSLILALQLATALGGLSVEEALIAGTAHAADALGKPTIGRLAVGSAADFIVVAHERALTPFYTWGHLPIERLYIGGNAVSQ